MKLILATNSLFAALRYGSQIFNQANKTDNMKRYVKFDEVVKLLNEGCEIFTDRAVVYPHTLYFKLWDDKESKGNIHHSTMNKLIHEKVIHGAGTPIEVRYKLIKGGN